MKLEEPGRMIPDTISVISWISLCGGVFQNTAADLICFDALEQRAKVAFAETFIALPLDEFKEDGSDDGFRESLQQLLGYAAFDHAFAVDRDAVVSQAVSGKAGEKKWTVSLF